MASNGNWNWEDGQLSFLDILTILSFIIGLENLELNQQQIDGLEAHLSQQDNDQLALIIKQNEELLEQNRQLINLLKEKK